LLAEGCPKTRDIRTSSQPEGSRHPDAQTRTQLTQLGPPHIHGEAEQRHETKVDTEAGMLSGVSRKRSIRSNPCWFTEFCKSQCLSHFAAPFIVVRAETSVAESCEEAFEQLGGRRQGRNSKTQQLVEDSDGRAEEKNSLACRPRDRTRRSKSPSAISLLEIQVK
jgi:hypothetical protein